MPTISGLHFPETIAQYCGFRQLLLFFDDLTQLLPSEDSAQPENPLVSAGMLKQHTSVPFGDDLEKFKRLIQDMQRHSPDFYGSAFSSLSSSNSLQVDEASVMSLISQMKPDNDVLRDSQRAEAFLQARILLKLTGIHELEEEKLQENIQSINEKKAHLLSALKGESEEMSPLMHNLDMGIGTMGTSSQSPLRLKRRLKAWAALLLADNQEPAWLATTGSNDAFELLADAVDHKSKAEPLFTISLIEPDELEYASFRGNFQTKTGECRNTLFTYLNKAAQTGVTEKNQKEVDAIEAWEESIQSIPSTTTRKLTFYLFNMPFADLLREGLNLKNVKPTKASTPNTVLGVVQ